MNRIEQYKSRYFEHFGSDNRVDNMIDISVKKRYNPVSTYRGKKDYVDALGAGGRRFESCHLDKYCSENNLINNPNRVAHFVTHFICRDDNRVDTVNK
jgi:hypothetical protein